MADVRSAPPSTRVLAPSHSGPSSLVPERTSTPLSSTTGPLRVSNTTPGSMAPSRSEIAAGSPSTIEPLGTGSESPSSLVTSSRSSCSSAPTRSDTPCSKTPSTLIARAFATGPVHVVPAGTAQPTVIPSCVRRTGASGRGPARPRGANVDEPITAGPTTGRRASTRGTPGLGNPARWGSANTAVASAPTNVSQRSRTRCAPARNSHSGRMPANGTQAGPGSGSRRYNASVTAADRDVLILCPDHAISYIVTERDVAHRHIAQLVAPSDAQQRVPRSDVVPGEGARHHRQARGALEHRDVHGDWRHGGKESGRITSVERRPSRGELLRVGARLSEETRCAPSEQAGVPEGPAPAQQGGARGARLFDEPLHFPGVAQRSAGDDVAVRRLIARGFDADRHEDVLLRGDSQGVRGGGAKRAVV